MGYSFSNGHFFAIDTCIDSMFFDVSNGKREAVDEPLATELVAPLLSGTEPVTGFRLTNKVWPGECWR